MLTWNDYWEACIGGEVVDYCHTCYGPVFTFEPFQTKIIRDFDRYATDVEFYYHIDCPNLVFTTLDREDFRE